MQKMPSLTSVQEALNKGDPLVRTWPMVKSYWTPFLIIGLYFLFIKRLAPILMKGRPPFNLRLVMIVYNFSIVAVYSACGLILCYTILTTDALKELCIPTYIRMNDYSYTCAATAWYLYILKYVELLDTVFFVLRKKFHLITNLHVIHHMVLPIIGWILFRTEFSGFQFIPTGINTAVHIIMYTYYGLAAMGPEMQRKLWWKKHLTRLQMIQFVVILFLTFVVIPLSGCQTHHYGYFFNIFFGTLFLVLFYNYYSKTYDKRQRNTVEINGKKNPAE